MEELFFILSMHRTVDSKKCVWWRPDAQGYTTSIGEAGRFTREEALQHSDPPHHLAIPCNVVDVPASRAKAFEKKALRASRFDAMPLDELSAEIATGANARAAARCPRCGRHWYPSMDASYTFPGSLCDKGECDEELSE